MDESGKAQATEAVAEAMEPRWMTGDADKDWVRFEGQFDRLDASLRHGLAGILALDGLLFIALAIHGVAGGDATSGLNAVSSVVIPLLGLVVTSSLFWHQFGALNYRRVLESMWDRMYPDGGLRPYRLPVRSAGSVALAPPALVGLLSALAWLILLAMHLVWYHALKQGTLAYEVYGTFMTGASVVAGIVLLPTLLFSLSALSDKMNQRAE